MDNLTDIQFIMLVFVLLQIKHFLADFVLQTNEMIDSKGTYGATPGIVHSLIHSLGTFLIFSLIHPVVGMAAALLDFLIHYHIDWAKIKINKKHAYTPSDKKFWIWFGLDQMAHQITYVFLVGWVFFGI